MANINFTGRPHEALALGAAIVGFISTLPAWAIAAGVGAVAAGAYAIHEANKDDTDNGE